MKQLYTKKEFSELAAIARDNDEQFRHEAAQAFAAYTRQQRKWARQLSHKTSADTFYLNYQSIFRPLVTRLTAAKSKTTAAKHLAADLELAQKDAETLAKTLRMQRIQQEIEQLAAPFPRVGARRATRLLQLPLDTLDSLAHAYKQQALYAAVASELTITVFDTHAPLLKKWSAKRRIAHSRQRRTQRETERLAEIARQLDAIDRREGFIVRKIVENELELMPLLALRNDFEKNKAKHQTADVPAELEQFDHTVKRFVKNYLDTYAARRPAPSLQQLGAKKTEIHQLLLDIFSLSNAARNRLVLTVSDYERLFIEQQRIAAAQVARNKYISLEQ